MKKIIVLLCIMVFIIAPNVKAETRPFSKEDKIKIWQYQRQKKCMAEMKERLASRKFLEEGIIPYCEQATQNLDKQFDCKERLTSYTRNMDKMTNCFYNPLVWVTLDTVAQPLSESDNIKDNMNQVILLLDIATRFNCSLPLMLCTFETFGTTEVNDDEIDFNDIDPEVLESPETRYTKTLMQLLN